MLSAAPATSVTSTSTSTSTTSTSTSTLTSSAAPLLSTASVSSALSSAPSSFCPVFASESPLLSNMVAALPASSPHLTNAMSNHVSSFTTSTTIPSPKLPPRPATAFPATSEHLSANYLAASPSSLYAMRGHRRTLYIHPHLEQYFSGQRSVKPYTSKSPRGAAADDGKTAKPVPSQQPRSRMHSKNTLESDELYNAVMMLEEDLDAAELDGGNSHMPPDSVIKRTTSCSGLSTYAAVMDAAMSPTSEVPRAFLNGKTTPCGCDGQRTGLASPPLSAGGCKFHKSVTSRISASSSPLISPIPRKLLAPSRFGFSANGKSVAGIGGLVGWPMERYSFESAEMTQAKEIKSRCRLR